MSRRFENKSAIVTGAAGGIGRAIATRLASEGAQVVIADLAQQAAQKAADCIGNGAIGMVCDVSDEAQVAACAAETVAAFGRLDVVVNNAGLMTFKGLDEWNTEEWLKVLKVDLVGAAMFTREAFRHMGSAGGAIVNVASIHALQTSPQTAPYAAAKAGMLSLTRTTSIEGKSRGIRANAVLPGAVDTPMLWENPNIKSGAETIDRDDVGAVADIAAAVAFLASEEARFISGTTLIVDGGRLARL
jgi:NAD(P)-dependent dehydrogenase (short-subunit alcohol dehydrogenase family)